VDKISKMRRTAMRLQEELGREPTDEELGEELGITASRVAQMRMAAIRPASLDAPIGDEDSNNFAEVVQDESADTPYEQLEEKDRHPDAPGDGQNAGSARSHHFARELRPGWRCAKDPWKRWGRSSGSPANGCVRFRTLRSRKLRKMIEKMETTKT
jgi:hypothetical protein